MKEYYTYAYLREDGTPYYVGKGRGKRAYDKNRHCVYVPAKERILFLKQNLTEDEAFKHEIYMIAVFGRKDLQTGILRNLTNGGEGCSGYKHTEESLLKLSSIKKGKKISEETRNKMSIAQKGRTFSDETKKRMSKGSKGIRHSEKTKKKIGEISTKRNKGRKWWNNGQQNKFQVECPGIDWKKGRIIRK